MSNIQLVGFWRKACVEATGGRLEMSQCSVAGAMRFSGECDVQLLRNEVIVRQVHQELCGLIDSEMLD